MVCHVNEQGEIKCGPSRVTTGLSTEARNAIRSALQQSVSEEKVELIFRLVAEVVAADIGNNCICTRSDDIVGSVQQLLQPATPLLLTYKYKALPGNILAAYQTEKANYIEAHRAVVEFSDDKLIEDCTQH